MLAALTPVSPVLMSIAAALAEIGRTVRYALASYHRTARLAMLITLAGAICWLVML
jgi:hypothetical protein